MSEMYAHVSVKILEKEYQISCLASERNALLDSAETLNKKMREITESNLNLKEKKKQTNYLKKRFKKFVLARKRNKKNILKLKKKFKKVELHDHHEAHQW